MKNIIIGGVARAGKTILAQKISQKHGYSHIPTDAIVGAFEIFPEHGILHDGVPYLDICRNFEDFARCYIINMDYLNIPYILDSYHILPETVAKHGWNETHEVVYLGFPNITVDEKFEHIRNYKNCNDWTDKVSDDALRVDIANLIERSRFLQSECNKYDITFYDTGKDFEQTQKLVLKNLKL